MRFLPLLRHIVIVDFWHPRRQLLLYCSIHLSTTWMLEMPSCPSTSSSFSPSRSRLCLHTTSFPDQASSPTYNELDSAKKNTSNQVDEGVRKCTRDDTVRSGGTLDNECSRSFDEREAPSLKGRDTSGDATESKSTFVKPNTHHNIVFRR